MGPKRRPKEMCSNNSSSSLQALQQLLRCLLVFTLLNVLHCASFFKNTGEPSGPSTCPINGLHLFIKVFDALINAEVVKHMTSNNLHSNKQYDFPFPRSNAEVLKTLTEYV